ncbi:MAG: hypothetical protein ACQESG_05640 [Nanobdellota archaeon]
MERLAFKEGDLTLYKAGLPGFPRNFTRDGIISALLCECPEMLRDQLIFCARKQGRKQDALTGEEPGKIFHEFPGYFMRGRYTTFNGCDTTALFLIGHSRYVQWTGDTSLFEAHFGHIQQAVDYIVRHVDVRGLFIEDPSFADADGYALRVTYWKDSVLVERGDAEPDYPVVYPLAHVQNLCALRSIQAYFPGVSLPIDQMVGGLSALFDWGLGNFYVALDGKGAISVVSSDCLHALYYLEPGDLSQHALELIRSSIKELETDYGFLTLSRHYSGEIEESYHTQTIWPFEQAIISCGARRFGMSDIAIVAEKVAGLLDTDPEIIEFKKGVPVKGGNDPQLWTIAAKEYFTALAAGTHQDSFSPRG